MGSIVGGSAAPAPRPARAGPGAPVAANMGHAGDMAITLPIGIRIAAGLLATTIDQIGKLPQELPTLALSLAGQTVRTSFRIRQEIAELATRGDELLSGLTGRPQEKPEWATFDEDEDEPVQAVPAQQPVRAQRPVPDVPAQDPAPAPAQQPVPVAVPTNRIRPGRPTGTPRTAAGAKIRSTPPAAGPGTPVTGDHLLSIAELKEELQDLGIAAVRELLVMEESGPNRAAYLTLLSNRLTTLAHENGQSENR